MKTKNFKWKGIRITIHLRQKERLIGIWRQAALSVLNEMIKTGMPSTKISAASFGDARPLVANDTPSNKKQNRRIEIVVLPDIESLPGYE